jgi:hypothetical protein
MKRIVTTIALFFGTAVSAQADQMTSRWYDTVRIDGMKRPDAVSQANVNHCNATVGVQYSRISAAYKACMNRAGYKLVSTHVAHVVQARSTMVYNRDSPDPKVGWHNEAGGGRVCTYDCDNPEIPGSGMFARMFS